MRELKFRAWDGKEMKPAFDLTQNPKFWWEENKDYPLMQFTGLKDKNDKEIYEGDILEVGHEVNLGDSTKIIIYKNVVEWEVGAFWVAGNLLTSSFRRVHEPAVIGNIYKNPELLEGEINV